MSVRISGGSAKGRKLTTEKRKGLRPTSERVRSAIYSIIGADGVDGKRVLDLYAGTGALGIEALSRGASWVDFVESNPKQCYMLRSSIKEMGFRDKARVQQAKVEKVVEGTLESYDLVFMDPPYELSSLEPILEKMGNSEVLIEKGLLIIEHSSRQPLGESYGRLTLSKTRRYGDSAISIFIMRDSNG